jgi:hypothetical protein
MPEISAITAKVRTKLLDVKFLRIRSHSTSTVELVELSVVVVLVSGVGAGSDVSKFLFLDKRTPFDRKHKALTGQVDEHNIMTSNDKDTRTHTNDYTEDDDQDCIAKEATGPVKLVFIFKCCALILEAIGIGNHLFLGLALGRRIIGGQEGAHRLVVKFGDTIES